MANPISITYDKHNDYVPIQVIFPKSTYPSVKGVVDELCDVISNISGNKPEFREERPDRFIVACDRLFGYSVGEFGYPGKEDSYEVLDTKPVPFDKSDIRQKETVFEELIRRIEARLPKKEKTA